MFPAQNEVQIDEGNGDGRESGSDALDDGKGPRALRDEMVDPGIVLGHESVIPGEYPGRWV